MLDGVAAGQDAQGEYPWLLWGADSTGTVHLTEQLFPGSWLGWLAALDRGYGADRRAEERRVEKG